jgi:hypothetical protein
LAKVRFALSSDRCNVLGSSPSFALPDFVAFGISLPFLTRPFDSLVIAYPSPREKNLTGYSAEPRHAATEGRNGDDGTTVAFW